MRILIASDQYPPSIGGVERTTQNLVWALRDMGHTVAVIAPGPSLWKTYTVEEESVPTLRVRSWPVPVVPGLRLSRKPGPVIQDFVAAFKPDVIQINNPYGLASSLIAYGREHNIPVVAGNHTMPEAHIFAFARRKRLFPLLKRHYWQWVARRFQDASAIVSPSHIAGAELVAAGITPQKTTTISNGVNLAHARLGTTPASAREALNLPERFTFIHFGRISMEKRIDHIVAAFAQLPAGCDAQLIIMGAGPALTGLRRQVKKFGLDTRVIFTGWISDAAEKYRYLAAAEVYVTASPMESQSIATLEAMAAGKAIIAADACALPELVQSGVNGELYPSGDITALAAALEKCIRQPSLVAHYERASLTLARHHDINAMPQHYVQLYAELHKQNSD